MFGHVMSYLVIALQLGGKINFSSDKDWDQIILLWESKGDFWITIYLLITSWLSVFSFIFMFDITQL